jgi:ubiquinone/menaquinone biosynthesis C-methylase UbiE
MVDEENLIDAWIPALEGVREKLADGARVADIGCRCGASTIRLAQAYPESRFWGFDDHEPSIRTARERAADAGIVDRVRFQVASARDFPGTGFDLVCHLDRLHDGVDPEGAARHAREVLAPKGTWMLEIRLGLGARADEARWRAVAERAGFRRFRRAAATPFHLVFEGRP